MSLAIGAVIAQAATQISAAAPATLPGRVWRRREESPLAPEAAGEAIVHLIHAILAESSETNLADVTACCALEAQLDAERRHVITLGYASNWDGVDFQQLLADRIGGCVSLATLTQAAALAEYEAGAGHDQESMLYILPTRGVTASFIAQGRIIEDAIGATESLDHWPVRDDGPRCACGGYGHLGALASAQAIVRTMIGRASASDESTRAMLRVSGARAEAMSAAQVVKLAADGDAIAQGVIRDAVEALASALAPLSARLDPSVIVVGGSLALAAPFYFDELHERLRARAGGGWQSARVMPGTLEPLATLTGAALLAARL
jgi:glucokinase